MVSWCFSQLKSSESAMPRSLWESTWGIMEWDIEYVVRNFCLKDKWIDFFILKFKSLSCNQTKRALIHSWRAFWSERDLKWLKHLQILEHDIVHFETRHRYTPGTVTIQGCFFEEHLRLLIASLNKQCWWRLSEMVGQWSSNS